MHGLFRFGDITSSIRSAPLGATTHLESSHVLHRSCCCGSLLFGHLAHPQDLHRSLHHGRRDTEQWLHWFPRPRVRPVLQLPLRESVGTMEQGGERLQNGRRTRLVDRTLSAAHPSKAPVNQDDPFSVRSRFILPDALPEQVHRRLHHFYRHVRHCTVRLCHQGTERTSQ